MGSVLCIKGDAEGVPTHAFGKGNDSVVVEVADSRRNDSGNPRRGVVEIAVVCKKIFREKRLEKKFPGS